MFRNAAALLGMLLASSSELAWAHSVTTPTVSSVTITRSGSHNFGGPFSLIDQSGRARSSADFRATPMLIYFGYTNCKDACPLDAQTITNVVDLLDKRNLVVAPIFITVDPQRDTPARLKEFLSSFHPRFVGLTGPIDKVTKITTAYGASGEGDQVNVKADGSYDVLHAAIAYLMGRNGEFLEVIHLKDDPNAIATDIAELVNKADR
jgi:protein SCO1/2